nr:response regulator [Bacteroidota bacterium]
VDVANNGQDAVNLFKKNLYDLVLMDIMMPIMDGIEATKQIKGIQDFQDIKRGIPVIAMTANALKGDREKLLSQGMDGYISKPFKTKELKDIIVNFFDKKSFAWVLNHQKTENQSDE